MDKYAFDRFRTRARRVELPASVRESVIDEIRAERGDRARAPRHPRRAVTRRAVVGAGLAAAGTAAAFLALGVILRPDERDPAAGEGNFFTLTAYAEGVPDAGSTVIAKQMVGESGSRGGSPELGWSTARTLDFRVTATGAKTIAYALEGPHVRRPPTEETIAEPCVYLDFIHDGAFYEQGSGEASPAPSGTYDGFTVEYADQEAEQELFRRVIWTAFPSDDELDALHQRQEDLWAARWADETYESVLAALRASNAFWSLVEKRGAELIAQTELVLTVTFEDGETQVKRYTVAPREDFDSIVAERDEKSAEYSAQLELCRNDPARQAEAEAAQQALEELHASTPDLYVLTETVG